MSARNRLKNILRIRAERIREQREATAFVAQAAAFPIYRAGGTTWRCKRCEQLALAWEDGSLAGCDCTDAASALEPTDPNYVVPYEADPEEQRLYDIEEAARHLIETMNLVGADKKPLFAISDLHDNASAGLLRHAVINLQAKLDGAETPHLALPQEVN